MRRYVGRNSRGRVFGVLGTIESQFVFEEAKRAIDSTLLLLIPAFIFSPVLFIILFIFSLIQYKKEIKTIFFPNKSVTSKYKTMFAPMVTSKMFATIGYRIYPEELEEHLALIQSRDSEDVKKLGKKGARMRRDMSRQFGFDTDTMTRHIFFLGTTGSGKTETIMSFFTDVIKNYAGIGMVDGKSDVAIEYKIYNLCAEHYYETQFYAIIFNKPEKGGDSNSYSPVLSYTSPMKASEFLGEFLSGGGGNGDYFANRGKVMLGNLVMHFKNRQKYYHEEFSLGDLSSATSLKNFNHSYYIAYCVANSIEQVIINKKNTNRNFAKIIAKAMIIKSPQSIDFANLEVLNEYVSQNPYMKKKIESILDVDFAYLKDYYNLMKLISEYMESIAPSWAKHTLVIGQSIYLYFDKKGRNFIYNKALPVSSKEVKILYKSFQVEDSEENQGIIKFLEADDRKEEIEKLNIALGITESAESAEKITAIELQQHSYASQQWDRPFALFNEFAHIMGTPFPDVDGEDIISNCKVLFVMLPVTELSEDQIASLGKVIILLFKNIASLALGGDKQSITPVQFKIFQNKVKPNPLFLMVLDEIGAYIPTSGLSLLLSQVRSLRIGMILSGQETVSVQPSGEGGSREQSRILGNTGKILFSNRDSDTKRFAEMVSDVEVIESDGYMKSAVDEKILTTTALKINKVPLFDVAVTSRFTKGFGVYIDDSRIEPSYFQSYYLGDNAKKPLQIRKFQAVQNMF